GRVALPDRAALTAALAAPDGAALAAASAAAERAASSPRAAAAAGAGARRLAGRRALDVALCRYREGHCLDDDELARLVLPLAAVDLRDEAWLRILAAGRDLDTHLDLWRGATRRVRPDLAPPPAPPPAVP